MLSFRKKWLHNLFTWKIFTTAMGLLLVAFLAFLDIWFVIVHAKVAILQQSMHVELSNQYIFGILSKTFNLQSYLFDCILS